jgi:hypothetical protein
MHVRTTATIALLTLTSALPIGCRVHAQSRPELPPKLTQDYAYWRGAYEKTPGPFLCVEPDAADVTVACDRWPDCSDLRRFGRDAIRLDGAETPHDRALAVWRWMRRVKSQTNGQAPTDPFHPERFDAQVNDPIKILNVYGAHWCSGLGRLTALIWRALGHEGHAVHRYSHGMAGLYYKDYDSVYRPHLFDCNFGGFTLDRTGRRVLTPDEFSTDYYMWMFPWYFGEPWPMPTHRVELALRRGEALRRAWGNWGKPFHDNISAEDDRGTRKLSEKGPYPVTYGNGRWTYRPDLSTPAWTKGLAEPPKGLAGAKLQPERAGKPAAAVWHFRTPYIAVDTTVEMAAFRKTPGDELKLSLSVDEGKTWQPFWTAPADKTGRQTFTVALNDTFKVVPRKWKVPKDFVSTFGRYAYRLKLELVAADRPENCRVERIAFQTTVQHAIRSLPQLWPGKNRITVRGTLTDGAALRLTYVWDDPEGKGRKNVTVAETLPYTYEIIAAGGTWEDVVCKELLVEAVPATGAGNRTVVKEKPSEIQELPPLPPAKETRTRWVRPLHREKHPSAEQVIGWLGNRRAVKKGLLWASELGKPETFDAVRSVAFDRELCKIKGVKELAMVALFNVDREKSRPLLLTVARDSACKTGWKYDPKNPAVAEGHWMSGVCIVGQMAAEAGWKEFVPALIDALDSKHCGSRHRMSILRSVGALVEPGDEKVAKAVRESLAMKYPYMLAQAALVAGKIQDKESIPRLRELLDHSFLAVRRRAAVALGRLGDTASAPRLRESLFRIRSRDVLDHHKYGTEIWMDENMRAAAAEALGLMRDEASLSALRRALANEPVPWVREKIRQAIATIE